MRRLSFTNEDEHHNFWQNYTDLMSGFLIVFIIASLTAYTTYRIYVNKFEKLGVSEANIKDIIIDAELYRKIKEFQDAQQNLNTEYFKYNSEYGRFECTIDVQFTANDFSNIQEEYKAPLIKAGQQLDSIIAQFSKSSGVKFKVIVEGRLANYLDGGESKWITPQNTIEWNRGMENSYKRARTVVNLWQKENIMKNLMVIDNTKDDDATSRDSDYAGELFIAGAGFGGQHRYKSTPQDPKGEDRNKTFVIQIIPYINF